MRDGYSFRHYRTQKRFDAGNEWWANVINHSPPIFLNRAIKNLTFIQHNDIVVFMIPEFIDLNGPWRVLPSGVHDATMKEIEERYALTAHRKLLFDGFQKGAECLWRAGCKTILLDGSYITEKQTPNDFDVCWDPLGVNTSLLDPIFFDFSNKRAVQKKRFLGEFFPSTMKATPVNFFTEFFQIDRYTGSAKGIIRVLTPSSISKRVKP